MSEGAAQAGHARPSSPDAAADELMLLIKELTAAAAIVSTRADGQSLRAAYLIGWLQQGAQGAGGK